VWVGVAVLSIAVLRIAFRWSQDRRQERDLGSVSDQWLSEYRASQTQDSRR
jgi:hypothetical protein